MTTRMTDTYLLRGHTIRNRYVLPPVVCFGYTGADGLVNEKHLEHYHERSVDGPGIVIIEATAVTKDGRTASSQLGIWSDVHTGGLARLASAVKGNGALALIQIHHAGMISPETVIDIAAGPSPDEKSTRTRALTVDEIVSIREDFIRGAIGARQAGFDGVELHGAHGYLLNQFASAHFNKRTDEYGGDFEGRMKFATDVIRGIREACGPDFIIGYRMGANSPLLEDGIRIAKYLESLGIDILHVSHGGSLLNLPRVPAGIEFNWIVFCGMSVKKEVTIPVIAVNEIRTHDRAAWLIGNGHADFAAIGRPQLADPHWVKHVLEGSEVNECLHCKPKCKWYQDSTLCPARIVLERKGEKTVY